MLEILSQKFERFIKRLKSHGKLTEKDVEEHLRELRIALLEADVNYKVAKEFISSIQQKAIGKEILGSLTAEQQIIKIVYDELVEYLGGQNSKLKISPQIPTKVMLVGLQGTGKTTTAGKLALMLRKKGHNPALVSTDIYRPAAKKQLEILAEQIKIPYFSYDEKPVEISLKSIAEARRLGNDVLIIDTAGRLHIDEELMNELKEMKQAIQPDEMLFIADAMVGQDAVKSANSFNEALDLTGIILTKLDGDAKGGAALSIKYITGKPIKFVGTGEKLECIEPFYPDRLASRILGMGDVLSLIEKAEESFSEKQAEELHKKIMKDEFTLEDFKNYLNQIRKMGPLENLLSMIPGMGKMNINVDEKEFIKVEAIINSMTLKERYNPHIIDGSRKKRIAAGSGTTVNDVNILLKQFYTVQKMMKQMSKGLLSKSLKKLSDSLFH
jgi:signal recognition particle subunit SRP54